MTEQLAIEGNEVIGTLEMEMIGMKKEVEEIKKGDSYWWRKWQAANDTIQDWMNKWRSAEDRVIKLERKLADAEKFADLWREHLDDTDPQEDNDAEGKARQILWDEGDTEKKYQAEEAIPF